GLALGEEQRAEEGELARRLHFSIEEKWGGFRFNKIGEVDSFGPVEVHVGGPTGVDLLLVSEVAGVDAGVGVILGERVHARSRLDAWGAARRGESVGPGRGR